MTFVISSDLVAHVLHINIHEGDKVTAGQEIALLESMKMEIPVIAEHNGTITAVKVIAGDVIQEGDIIATLE
ncbi:biotin/lipoyl-binding carrier protein [Dermatophilus congolensis]|uniref:Biotinylated protein TB7.3 n=1 Tax=Dermatophilus congolensis TaxID=1863 RepID=A0A239V910_9MICO|nr:biotin/lipoyl-binding carrier protein [Dermatophilus congolensis]MBO3130496.1 biotin/lipoyl-binding carrier protein [Dermatophilus congolensis]MBO3130874.1 biotin/lipoyl-binding carrier protein [Dermatophilus congolensis]MBO3134968.1 biotin/lipoyl-binding carrier protein [Dermatophilus congolensis]MBO3137207.1 biotin/lipoyl-binding carrier protein [Dermatophilus congolensis]MBO3139450.1 biotin/lipoyl-binding carrier protein [Dermatophilus congolensis]